MRRLSLAVLSGALILGACTDASHQEPSDIAALKRAAVCPTGEFPLADAESLLSQLYPNAGASGHAPGDMPAHARDIARKWSGCQVDNAQRKVGDFVDTLLADFGAGKLTGGTSPATLATVAQLVNVVYSGVGFGTDYPAPPLPEIPAAGPDVGIGFFTPNQTQPLLVQTTVADGAALIPANAFTEPTVITVSLRPDTPNPFDGTGQAVLPPFYEITASNSSGTHYLANGQAVVGFCVEEATLNSLTDPAIAHLAVAEGSNPGGFEVLSDASDPQYDALGLDCDRYVPPVIIGSLFDDGFSGFAREVPGMAAHYLRSVAAAVFLPRRLEAAFRKLGLGSLASSLSPFGVTDRGNAPPPPPPGPVFNSLLPANDNGPVDARTSQIPSDASLPSQVFDDFTLANGATISSVQWQGIYCTQSAGAPAPAPTATEFRVSIYSDNSGLPSTAVPLADEIIPVAASNQVFEQNITGLNCGNAVSEWAFYGYSATLTTPFVASAGTKYWLSIQAITPSYAAFYGWRNGLASNNLSLQLFNNSYTSFGVDRAFALTP